MFTYLCTFSIRKLTPHPSRSLFTTPPLPSHGAAASPIQADGVKWFEAHFMPIFAILPFAGNSQIRAHTPIEIWPQHHTFPNPPQEVCRDGKSRAAFGVQRSVLRSGEFRGSQNLNALANIHAGRNVTNDTAQLFGLIHIWQ